jgi:hypothetical protein
MKTKYTYYNHKIYKAERCCFDEFISFILGILVTISLFCIGWWMKGV